MEKDISNEEYERVRNNLGKFSYLDLTMWRNQLINSGTVNNRLYNLIDTEIKRRYIERNTDNKESVEKSK